MPTHITSKGQVTIPKKIRDALKLVAGDGIEFGVNSDGDIVLRKAGGRKSSKSNTPDRFAAMRGKAQVKWRTDELMALLRGD
jgi:AbrB family looped-hinge helix DNA binding protein